MNLEIFPTPDVASEAVAAEMARLIRQRQREGRQAVIGFATGKTPLPLYTELIRLHREDGLSFGNVVSFNLDEYLGLSRDHPCSYWQFMQRHLFSKIDLSADNIHIPRGDLETTAIDRYCADYEVAIERAGGIDFQILGIGRSGHIGFNEPGSGRGSRTRLVTLDALTRADAAADFAGLENVPRQAITMGCGTILAARKIALLAWGAGKAAVIRQALEGPVADALPASYLQQHPGTSVFLDEPAAGLLILS